MKTITTRLQWFIAALLWIYILYRAVHIGITQDEAYSYFLVKTNYWRAMPGSLNTHWLNTLGIRLFLWLPGADEVWKLRMLSVFSWWLYAFSVIKLGSAFKNSFIGSVFFLAAVLNPFLIFYFSLGRGYGPSCAFILFSIWQAFRLIRGKEMKPSEWLKVFFPAAMAVLANFSSFYFFIGVTVTYVLHLLANRKANLLFASSALKWILTVTAISGFATFSLLFIRYHTRDFDGSQTSDFISSLYSSQILSANYLIAGQNFFVTGWLIFILFVILAVASGSRYFMSREMTIGTYCIFVAAVIVLCNAGFYLLFRTPFVFARTGLMFYVSSVPAFFFLADEFAPGRRALRVGLHFLMGSIGIVFIANAVRGINIRYFSEFPFQADTEKSLDHLQDMQAKHVGLTIWHYAAFVNYYAEAFPDRYKFSTVLIDRNLPNPQLKDCDYLLITESEPGRDTLLNNRNVVWRNPATRAIILANK